MGYKKHKDLSPCEIRQKLKEGSLGKGQINKLRKRLCFLNKDSDEMIENWMKSPVIKQGCYELYKNKKCKPVYKEDILIGYEYDLLEAVWERIKKVRRDDKKRKNKNNKDGFKLISGKNPKIHQMAER